MGRQQGSGNLYRVASSCVVRGMTQFCAGFTVIGASTYLSDAGGGEVNFLRVTSTSACFVRFGRRAPGFGTSVGFFTVRRNVGNPYCVAEVSYPLLVLKCLGLEA